MVINFYGYIYKTTNLINGKIYIGQHKNKIKNKSYFGSGKILNQAIKKYGIDNFKNEIICWCKDRNELNEKEIFYIYLYKKYFDLYNLASGGEGGNLLLFASDERKRESYNKMINTRKRLKIGQGENNPMYKSGEKGIHPMLGKKQTEESKNKISESLKGNIPWNKGMKKPKKEISKIDKYMNNKSKSPLKITHLKNNEVEYFESRSAFKKKYENINIKYALHKCIFKDIKFENISKEELIKEVDL